ncbi:hypothetical protein ASPSYDRAFT_39405 [Aspergillus sydowii CBS 593.65]|uniref:Uncharacterized protein n=1 Tax=Aspergillus sydowii CBS 593.65 TaxID=1036612 RepID=A0A1L9TYZ4_9EURO|nr:uncharacterized protein ASPSYDRAFT_39405 [Aspergillus sydowii CBS 593.65]OJJ64660.1 hypothetical protein ASPSYDRAFT_39405 [Aspergillus sydowii CBS 593.65]
MAEELSTSSTMQFAAVAEAEFFITALFGTLLSTLAWRISSVYKEELISRAEGRYASTTDVSGHETLSTPWTSGMPSTNAFTFNTIVCISTWTIWNR